MESTNKRGGGGGGESGERGESSTKYQNIVRGSCYRDTTLLYIDSFIIQNIFE